MIASENSKELQLSEHWRFPNDYLTKEEWIDFINWCFDKTHVEGLKFGKITTPQTGYPQRFHIFKKKTDD